jgi:hypothetical protein
MAAGIRSAAQRAAKRVSLFNYTPPENPKAFGACSRSSLERTSESASDSGPKPFCTANLFIFDQRSRFTQRGTIKSRSP